MRSQCVLLAIAFALAAILSSCSNSDSEKQGGTKTESATVTVYVTRTGQKYHRGGCQYLSKSQVPMTLKAAKAAGYTPCSRCGPPQ